ncbi:hypothetical protein HDU67_007816, partial [Dinochytrium kinnereticum]
MAYQPGGYIPNMDMPDYGPPKKTPGRPRKTDGDQTGAYERWEDNSLRILLQFLETNSFYARWRAASKDGQVRAPPGALFSKKELALEAADHLSLHGHNKDPIQIKTKVRLLEKKHAETLRSMEIQFPGGSLQEKLARQGAHQYAEKECPHFSWLDRIFSADHNAQIMSYLHANGHAVGPSGGSGNSGYGSGGVADTLYGGGSGTASGSANMTSGASNQLGAPPHIAYDRSMSSTAHVSKRARTSAAGTGNTSSASGGPNNGGAAGRAAGERYQATPTKGGSTPNGTRGGRGGAGAPGGPNAMIPGPKDSRWSYFLMKQVEEENESRKEAIKLELRNLAVREIEAETKRIEASNQTLMLQLELARIQAGITTGVGSGGATGNLATGSESNAAAGGGSSGGASGDSGSTSGGNPGGEGGRDSRGGASASGGTASSGAADAGHGEDAQASRVSALQQSSTSTSNASSPIPAVPIPIP